MSARLAAVLDEVEEYLGDRADADCAGDPPEYRPNRAMMLLVMLREVRAEEGL